MSKLTYGTPEEAGFDPGRIAALKDRAPAWIDALRMRSAVLLAARRGKIVFHEAYGPLTDQSGSPALQEDSIFTINSVTKPITATAVMVLVEDGRLGLNRPIKEYLPEVCGEETDAVDVQHLLTHTSGFDKEEAEAQFQQRISSLPHMSGDPANGLHLYNAMQLACHWDLKSHWTPGSKMSYCSHNYFLLGEIIRRVSGQSLSDFAKERLFNPLGMKDTSYTRDETKLERWVRRGDDVPLGSVSGDARAGVEGKFNQTAPWGNTGVNSTALDLAAFGQMFLNKGSYDGESILSPGAVHEMTRDQIPGVGTDFLGDRSTGASWGLGWSVQGDERWRWHSGTLTPKGTFNHGGAGGLYLWVDPVNEIVGVYLSVCLDLDMETLETHTNADLFQNMVTAAVAV